MKIFAYLFLSLLFAGQIAAQTIYWEEDFNYDSGWTLEEENWYITSSMLQFAWFPDIQNFDLSAISPPIVLNENVHELSILQYLDIWSPTNYEFAEIIIIHGDEETIIWDYALINGNWGYEGGEEIVFSMEEFAGEEVQFKFRTYGGSTYNWNYWSIYNMKLTAVFDNDLCVENILGPQSLEIGEPATFNVVVKNLGTNPQTGFVIDLFNYRTEEWIGTHEVTEIISNGESFFAPFEWTAGAAQNTSLYAEIHPVLDDFADNNISDGFIVRVNPDIEFSLLVWDHDNDIATIIDPEKGDFIQPDVGITRALDGAGIDYEKVYNLPENLNDYDIVIATMGCYCLS